VAVRRVEELASHLDRIDAADEAPARLHACTPARLHACTPARLHGDLWAGNRMIDRSHSRGYLRAQGSIGTLSP